MLSIEEEEKAGAASGTAKRYRHIFSRPFDRRSEFSSFVSLVVSVLYPFAVNVSNDVGHCYTIARTRQLPQKTTMLNISDCV